MRAVLCVFLCLIALPAQGTIYDIDSTENIWAAACANALLTAGWTDKNEFAELADPQYRWPSAALDGWFASRSLPSQVSRGFNNLDFLKTCIDNGYGVIILLADWTTGYALTVSPFAYDEDSIQFTYAADMDYLMYDYTYAHAVHPFISPSNVIGVDGNKWYMTDVIAVAKRIAGTPVKSTSVPEPTGLTLLLLALPLLGLRKRLL